MNIFFLKFFERFPKTTMGGYDGSEEEALVVNKKESKEYRIYYRDRLPHSITFCRKVRERRRKERGNNLQDLSLYPSLKTIPKIFGYQKNLLAFLYKSSKIILFRGGIKDGTFLTDKRTFLSPPKCRRDRKPRWLWEY